MADMEEVQVELVVDIRKCCRLCLVADEKEKYGNIFKHNLLTETSVSIVEALRKVTGLDVSVDVNLPERICDGCCRKLEDSFRFINEVVSNNAILIELLNPETAKEERTGHSIELGDESENESEITTALEAHSPKPRNKRKAREKTPAYVDDDLSEACSDEEPTESASPDELDAVNLILKNFSASQRETKAPRAPFSRSRGKVHKCDQCEKVFLRKSNLIDHQRLHSQTKLYQCEYCDKSFVQNGNLVQHLRTHTAEKPYSCTVCNKGFSQSSALKTHMNIHLQLRPFECSKCSKAFSSSSDRRKHMLTHDSKKRFCCPMCSDRVFTQKVHLRMHLTRIHPHCNVAEMVTRGTTDSGNSPARRDSTSPTRTAQDD